MLPVLGCASTTLGSIQAVNDITKESRAALAEALLDCNVPECDKAVVAGAELLRDLSAAGVGPYGSP